MILVRLLSYLRRHWPQTHILVRGDSHFATPEVLDVIASYRWTDFVFGLAGNAVLLRQAEPVLQDARRLYQQGTALAQAHHRALQPAAVSMPSLPMPQPPGPSRGASSSKPK